MGEFDKLGPFAHELAEHLSHLERRRLQILDLQPVCHLGKGAFGEVSLVKHAHCSAKYALKRVPKDKNGKVPQDVARECTILTQVQHPFVLQFVASIETGGDVCIVTEFLGGGDLFDLMRRRTFSRSEIQFYGGSLVLALEALHTKHIVHRDLKPENVMLDA